VKITVLEWHCNDRGFANALAFWTENHIRPINREYPSAAGPSQPERTFRCRPQEA
jgi:hypothetical protein